MEEKYNFSEKNHFFLRDSGLNTVQFYKYKRIF